MSESKNKMDEFVETMERAFKLANEIEGISNISWSIGYEGTVKATNEIALRIGDAMAKAETKNTQIILN